MQLIFLLITYTKAYLKFSFLFRPISRAELPSGCPK